jgi:uncharacterized membrane protein YfcA
MPKMINISTPALLFPAVSLLLLAYTNRFVALASLVRNLHAQWIVQKHSSLVRQIEHLRRRLFLVRNMQALGLASMLCCVVSMFLFLTKHEDAATVLFAVSLILLAFSMIISLVEIIVSVNALEVELADIETSK